VSVQDSSAAQAEAQVMSVAQDPAQNAHIVLLATDLELPDEAIDLAEKHEILPTLAHILQSELDTISRFANSRRPLESQLRELAIRSEFLKDRVRHCFEKFGTKWATAFFESEIENQEMFELLEGWPEHQSYLTSFLRSKPEYAKISWINDVNQEEEFGQASKALLNLGLRREHDLWSKKIELSIGKLALLADRGYSQADGILIPDGGKTELTDVHGQLGLIKIQNRVYDFVVPSISTAIDENAEVQLALEVHGNKALNKQLSLKTILEERMGSLVRQEAMTALALIDLLTLMGDNGGNTIDQETFRSQQFSLALRASCYGILNKDEQNLTQKIIWRRCMLRDDWSEVNNTAQKDDQQVSEQLAKTALYQTFRACLQGRKSSVKSVAHPSSLT
jgi:nuclear pore complex protein Nup133